MLLDPSATSHYPVIAAMLAPALFLTASGSLLQNANNRLARISDRLRDTRDLPADHPDHAEARVDLLRRRADLVLRALQFLHLAVSSFVVTSLGIALDAAFAVGLSWIPTIFAMIGVCLLLAGSLSLWKEARLAVRSLELSLKIATAYRSMPRP